MLCACLCIYYRDITIEIKDDRYQCDEVILERFPIPAENVELEKNDYVKYGRHIVVSHNLTNTNLHNTNKEIISKELDRRKFLFLTTRIYQEK